MTLPVDTTPPYIPPVISTDCEERDGCISWLCKKIASLNPFRQSTPLDSECDRFIPVIPYLPLSSFSALARTCRTFHSFATQELVRRFINMQRDKKLDQLLPYFGLRLPLTLSKDLKRMAEIYPELHSCISTILTIRNPYNTTASTAIESPKAMRSILQYEYNHSLCQISLQSMRRTYNITLISQIQLEQFRTISNESLTLSERAKAARCWVTSVTTSLTQIDCRAFDLTCLPGEFFFCKLESIDLPANHLLCLPDLFAHVRQSLRHVDVSDNPMTTLPSSISELRHLSSFLYVKNPMRQLPPESKAKLGNLDQTFPRLVAKAYASD